MSSPPSNTPIPHPPSLQNPRKRPSINTNPTDNPATKRRKPSTMSNVSSGHPLRQTSFPPPENAHQSRQSSFSPPASATGRSSLAGGRGGGGSTTKRGRGGRPRKTDVRSTAGTSATGGKEPDKPTPAKTGSTGAVPGKSLLNAPNYDDDPDEEDDEGGQDLLLESSGLADEAQTKLEAQHLQMLVEAFSPEQAERYTLWRRVRLGKSVVRRLVNQTLSQSVPQSVVTTVNGYSKLFAGEIIEGARDVQAEWLAASEKLPTGEVNPNFGLGGKGQGVKGGGGEGGGDPNGTGEDHKMDGAGEEVKVNGDALIYKLGENARRRIDVKEMDKGPLTPDHLREALRRYKRDREGGSTGFQGLSLYGQANTASRNGGKRLFR